MSSSDLKLGFIGAGRAATALALGLQEQGYCIAAVSSRTPSSAESLAGRIDGCAYYTDLQSVADTCDLVFITTPDSAIESVARQLQWRAGAWVAHCSGAESTDILEAAREQGALVGSFHPMQTFPGTENAAASLLGIAYAVEGPPPLADALKEMAHALGGWPVEIDPQDRALYHLSGFLACGAVVALMAQASELWKVMGYSREEGQEVLLPILRSTVDSLETRGIPAALTGPISRGDISTVIKHLDALESRAPSVLPIYCRTALGAVSLSMEKGGIDGRIEQELIHLLEKRLSGASGLFVS